MSIFPPPSVLIRSVADRLPDQKRTMDEIPEPMKGPVLIRHDTSISMDAPTANRANDSELRNIQDYRAKKGKG